MSARDRDLLSLLETQVSRRSGDTLYNFLNKDISISRSLTYADVYEQALVIAATLQERGLQNSPIALLYPHGADFITAFLGTILAGSWPVPLARSRGQDWSVIFRILKVSGATAVLTLSSMRKTFPEPLQRGSGLHLLCTDTSELLADVHDWRRPDVKPDDVAFIQYTSGSTSWPRGVIVTHANVLHNSEQIRRSVGCSEDEVSVSWLPFHHDMGLIAHIIQPLYAGMLNYFLSPVDFIRHPQRWLTAISRFGGTISGAPNFAYALCAGHGEPAEELHDTLDLSSWRVAYCGAERVVPAVLKRFAQRYRSVAFDDNAFFPCYGLAESTLFVCGQYGFGDCSGVGYSPVGHVPDGAGIVIVDPVEELRLGDGVVGEIWLKSPSVSPGYFNDPEATREHFHQSLDGVHGYMRTGDLAFIRDGTLHFVGRRKNVIKRLGRSFHAEDIEEIVEQALLTRGIGRCAAFSVVDQEEEYLILLLEHDGTASADDMASATREASMVVCNALGVMPDVVQEVPKRSLPRTTSGKLQRAICRHQYLRVRDSSMAEQQAYQQA